MGYARKKGKLTSSRVQSPCRRFSLSRSYSVSFFTESSSDCWPGSLAGWSPDCSSGWSPDFLSGCCSGSLSFLFTGSGSGCFRLCDPVLDLGEFLFTDAFFNGFILDRVAESGGENIEIAPQAATDHAGRPEYFKQDQSCPRIGIWRTTIPIRLA